MYKNLFVVLIGAIMLSGCSLADSFTGISASKGSVWKSPDGGISFVEKSVVDEKRRISSADVLSFVFDPHNSNRVYIGTREHGIFRTENGGESWEPLLFPPLKVYGLTIDASDSNRVYASGTYENVAKIYRSDDGGTTWGEIYTEPASGSVITALESHPDVPGTLYAGLSSGLVLKSADQGATWRNIVTAENAVTKIIFEPGLRDTVSLLVFEQGVMLSRNGGQDWSDFAAQTMQNVNFNNARSQNTLQTSSQSKSPQKIFTLARDPSRGTLYAGASNGLFRSDNHGEDWQPVSIIESSRNFPIRAVSINPMNSNEIVYAAGRAFFKSIDGGIKWSTTQLDIDREVGFLKYDPLNPQTLYATLRKF